MSVPETAAQTPEAAAPTEAAADPAELLDLLQRERADFQNYRRRVQRERAEDRRRAQAETIARLFPLLDDLDRALAQTPVDLAGDAWGRGLLLSRHHLTEALTELGVERVGAEGERFDTALHEAVIYRASADAPERTVSVVLRSGYRLGPRLVRPAQVEVVGPSSGDEHAPGPGTGTPDGHEAGD